MPTSAEPTPREFLYTRVAGQAWRSRARELVLSGPRGTGKSRPLLEYIRRCAEEWPGFRGLLVRKTRDSLTESGLVTWESEVLPQESPAFDRCSRKMRQAYNWPNGSTFVIGGMDNPGKFMSTGFDVVMAQELIEFRQEEWEAVTSCLDRPGLVMPYSRAIADTNPGAPSSWILARVKAGQMSMIDTTHKDNPMLHDGRDWTDLGVRYRERLEQLTGLRRLRLYEGKWVQAEGQVYDEWRDDVHIVEDFDVPASWSWYWSIDFGYSEPFVVQAWAKDEDNRLYLMAERFRTHCLVEDHAKAWMALGLPKPREIFCDHDAEGRATWTKYTGLPTTAAYKSRLDGVQFVQARMKVRKDKTPGLAIVRNAVEKGGGRDPVLLERMVPASTIEEISGYVWDDRGGRRKGEATIDRDDHGVDAMRMMVASLDRRAVPSTLDRISPRYDLRRQLDERARHVSERMAR